MKALRIFVAVILMAGGCLTARAAYLHAKAELAGVLIRRAWEQSAQSGEPRAPWPWADTHPIAEVRIPRLDYDEIVLDGATPRTLAFGPALLMSGAALGKAGNVVLAGHRTSWFRPLENIARGDTIQLAWFHSRRGALYERTYTVELIQVVEPQNVTLLAPTAEDALTLITCYPFGSSPHSPLRYVVRASPVGPSTLANRSTMPNRQHANLASANLPVLQTTADSIRIFNNEVLRAPRLLFLAFSQSRPPQQLLAKPAPTPPT